VDLLIREAFKSVNDRATGQDRVGECAFVTTGGHANERSRRLRVNLIAEFEVRRSARGTRRSVVTAFDLEGRTAVVTGGNGGIGLGIVTAVGETGADIVWWARDADKPQRALRQLLDAGAADS
jgi:hypothetical protein